MQKDTIAAISTALGESAISIVRMSGPDVFSLANALFSGKDLHSAQSHTLHYGKIYDGQTMIDEVLVSVFKAPKTFTREHMVEINCHGGIYAAKKILELLLVNGARLAEKGEFTERAFLNGRIDLTQAESIMDIIESRSEQSLTLAAKGVDGKIYSLVSRLRDNLLDIIAAIEVNIDYPEYDDVETLTTETIVPKINALQEEIRDVLSKAKVGRVLKEGVKTAIIGRPNVGKSSVLNALLREDKAIVTEIQGTTRDTVEGEINIGGVVLKLIDTAGIRDSQNMIEKIGIDKARAMIDEAQLILYVLNNNEPLNDEDEKLLKMTENKSRIVIINKIDLENKIERTFKDSVQISALRGTNIDALEQRIENLFLGGEVSLEDTTYLSNARQIAKMRQVKNYLDESLHSAQNLMPVDMIEIDLKNAWETLGEIIGQTKDSALIDELFSKFCLGK